MEELARGGRARVPHVMARDGGRAGVVVHDERAGRVLQDGGLAIVGSRNVDQAGTAFAQRVARTAAQCSTS